MCSVYCSLVQIINIIGDVFTPLSHEILSVQNVVLSWLPNLEKATPIICRYYTH